MKRKLFAEVSDGKKRQKVDKIDIPVSKESEKAGEKAVFDENNDNFWCKIGSQPDYRPFAVRQENPLPSLCKDRGTLIASHISNALKKRKNSSNVENKSKKIKYSDLKNLEKVLKKEQKKNSELEKYLRNSLLT